MYRLIAIFITYIISVQLLSAQVALEKTSFDLGEISLLNEDVIDLSLTNHTADKLFIIRISSEDHVRVKFSSRTIEAGSTELLRVKLNPKKLGKYKTKLQIYFAQNLEAIDLDFTAEVLAIPVNQLQACPDFSTNRPAIVSPVSYQKQEKGEIRLEQLAVVQESELKEYLKVKKEEELAALASQEHNTDIAELTKDDDLESIKIDYNYQADPEPQQARISENTPEHEKDELEEIEYSYQTEVEPEEKRIRESKEKPAYKENSVMEKKIDSNLLSKEYVPNNIVFLLDASTSMSKDGKIKLLKSSMKELLVPLRLIDRIAIVSYAGEARLLLASTEASDKETISEIIDNIPADGNTNAVKGLRMALQVAKSNFIEGGNNQIILATDGAFDIGSRNDRLRNKISNSAKEEIIISVIGIKNDNWTNKSLKEIAELGGGDLLRIHSDRNLAVILEEVKSRSLR